jgi:hypothetical protein
VQKLFDSDSGSEAPSTGAAYASNRVRILVNRVLRNGGFAPGELSRAVGHAIFAQLPSEEGALADAYCEGSLLPDGSALRKAIAEMAAKIAGVDDEKPQRRFRWFRS